MRDALVKPRGLNIRSKGSRDTIRLDCKIEDRKGGDLSVMRGLKSR